MSEWDAHNDGAFSTPDHSGDAFSAGGDPFALPPDAALFAATTAARVPNRRRRQPQVPHPTPPLAVATDTPRLMARPGTGARRAAPALAAVGRGRGAAARTPSQRQGGHPARLAGSSAGGGGGGGAKLCACGAAAGKHRFLASKVVAVYVKSTGHRREKLGVCRACEIWARRHFGGDHKKCSGGKVSRKCQRQLELFDAAGFALVKCTGKMPQMLPASALPPTTGGGGGAGGRGRGGRGRVHTPAKRQAGEEWEEGRATKRRR